MCILGLWCNKFVTMGPNQEFDNHCSRQLAQCLVLLKLLLRVFAQKFHSFKHIYNFQKNGNTKSTQVPLQYMSASWQWHWSLIAFFRFSTVTMWAIVLTMHPLLHRYSFILRLSARCLLWARSYSSWQEDVRPWKEVSKWFPEKDLFSVLIEKMQWPLGLAHLGLFLTEKL